MTANRLPIPGQDPEEWGEILNDYLRVSLDETGGINILDVVYVDNFISVFESFTTIIPSDFILNKKNHKIYFYNNLKWEEFIPDENFTGVNKHTGTIFRWSDSKWVNFPENGVVNVKDWGARGDYNPYTLEGNEDSDAVQAAIDYSGNSGAHLIGKTVYFPNGRYLIAKTLNITTDNEANKHSNLTVCGDGIEITNIYASTGGILFDFSGSNQICVKDFTVYGVNVANPSTVAILIARAQKHPWANLYRISGIRIYLNSDIKANNGIGTVGIWNYGGEHHTYTDINISANLPVVLTRWRDPDRLPGRISSSNIELLAGNAGSQIFTSFLGTCILIAWDYHRPCLYLNRVACVHLFNTYMSPRAWPHQNLPKGTYVYAVEAHDVFQYIHHGMLEGPGATDNQLIAGFGYLKVNFSLEQADIRVLLSPIGESLQHTAQDALPSSLEISGGIQNSTIEIRYPVKTRKFPPVTLSLTEGTSVNNIKITNTKLISTNAQHDANLIVSDILKNCLEVELYDYVSNIRKLIDINISSTIIQNVNPVKSGPLLDIANVPVARNDPEAYKIGLISGQIYRTPDGTLKIKM